MLPYIVYAAPVPGPIPRLHFSAFLHSGCVRLELRGPLRGDCWSLPVAGTARSRSNQSGEGDMRKNIIEADRWTASCLAEASSSFFLATSANGSRGNGLPGNCDCRRS